MTLRIINPGKPVREKLWAGCCWDCDCVVESDNIEDIESVMQCDGELNMWVDCPNCDSTITMTEKD